MNQELKIIVREDGTVQVVGKLNALNSTMNTTQQRAGLIGSAFKNYGKQMLTYASATLTLGAAIKTAGKALEAFNQQFMALKEVQAVINSTGRTAEFTAQELNGMAGELQKVSNYGDDEIMAGATVSLLRFASIGKQDFPRVQKLVVDMAKSMGGLDTAAKSLGLALEMPEVGITRLRRAGVVLTQQQEDLVKALVASGDHAGAQQILIAGLESKYKDMALAGVSVSTQLKNAWGDYLETIGGSLSVMDGVKKGLSVYFMGIANDSKNLSNEQIKHVYDTQEAWAKAILSIAERAKQSITILGGVAISAFGLVQDVVNGVYFSINNVKSGIVSLYNGLSGIAPRIMEAITGVSSFGEAWENLKEDFGSGTKDMVGIEAFGAQSQKNMKNWIALFDNANNKIATGKKEITDFYEAQRKLLDQGSLPAGGEQGGDTGLDLAGGGIDNTAAIKSAQDYLKRIQELNNTEIQNVIAKYDEMRAQLDSFLNDRLISDEQYSAAAIEINSAQARDILEIGDNLAEAHRRNIDEQLKAEQEAAEAAKKLQNDKLSAQLAYLQAVKPLTDEYRNAQIDAYRRELEAYLDLGLSKMQIDDMVNAYRLKLESETSQEIIAQQNKLYQQAYQQFQNIVNGLGQLTEQRKQKEIDSMEETAERENWTNDKRLAAKKAINKKYEAEEKRLHMVQRIMSIAQAVINTAEGVTAALKLGPAGIPLAVLIGALGTVEVGVIAAQKFARGGQFRGAGSGTDDQNLIRVSNGEYIVNAEATRLYKPLLDAINFGNRKQIPQASGYANGGIVNFAMKDNSIPLLSLLNDNITGLRDDLKNNGLELKGSDGIPLMKFISKAAMKYRTA